MANTVLKVVWLTPFISQNKHFFYYKGQKANIGLVIACITLCLSVYT